MMEAKMNKSPQIIIIAPVPPKRPYKIWKLIKLIIYLTLAFGLCGGVFAFVIKYTEEYACVLNFVKEDRTVLQTVGEPVEPGLTAWLSYFQQAGGVRQTAFRFSVTGPKGQGRVEASTYRSSIGSSMFIRFEGQEIYNGVYSCP
jgi:hypothetical protein